MVSPRTLVNPKRVLMEAADKCRGGLGDLGYSILMNVWCYLHYGEARYPEYKLRPTTADFWEPVEDVEVEFGTELCNN